MKTQALGKGEEELCAVKLKWLLESAGTTKPPFFLLSKSPVHQFVPLYVLLPG